MGSFILADLTLCAAWDSWPPPKLAPVPWNAPEAEIVEQHLLLRGEPGAGILRYRRIRASWEFLTTSLPEVMFISTRRTGEPLQETLKAAEPKAGSFQPCPSSESHLRTSFGAGCAPRSRCAASRSVSAAFVALVGFSRSFEEQWVKLYESSGTDIAVVQKTFLNTFVDESVGEKLRALPFVAAADPVIVNLMDLTPEVNALVYGWPANSFEMDTLTLLQGRRFHDDQPEVMLGEVLAENLGKKPGDAMDIQGATLQVVGVFRGGSALEAGAAVLPLRELQKLSDLGGKVTAFHVHLRKGAGGESEAQLMQKRSRRD